MEYDGRGGPRKIALVVFLASLSLYTLTAGGSLSSTDATVMFDLTRNIVEERSLALSGNLLGLEANRGTDGRYYSQYGLGQSLYNIPFYLAGTAAQRLVGRQIGKPDTIPKAVVALGNTVAAALVVSVVWLFALRLSGAARASMWAAASVAIASPLWPYSKFGFATPLTALVLLVAAYCLLKGAESGRTGIAAVAGAVMAFGWLTRHEIALALVPFALYLFAAGRARGRAGGDILRQQFALLGVAALGGLAWGAYNYVRFGSPTFVGYSPAFGTTGYLAYLASPGGALWLFCPIAVVWILGALSRPVPERLLLVGPFVGFFLFYGALADWAGGRSYGPRYLVPAVVLLAPALAPYLHRGTARVRAMVIAVICLSAIVQLPGVVVDYSKVSLDWARSAPREAVVERNWRWDASPLVLNARAAAAAVPLNAAYLTGRKPLPDTSARAAADDRDFAQRFSFSVDFWWAYLVYLRAISPAAGLSIALALLLFSMAFGTSAWRASGRLQSG